MDSRSNTFFVDLQGFHVSGRFYLKELCILECNGLTCHALYNKKTDSDSDADDDWKHPGEKIHHYIFKPPFEWSRVHADARKVALWLKSFHHGFSWNDGDTDYSEIETIITKILTKHPGTPTVYVKGYSKLVCFNNFMKGKFRCIDLNDMGCSFNLRNLEDKKSHSAKHCHRHNESLHCAIQNVDILHFWTHILH